MMEAEEFKAIFLPLGRMMYAEAVGLLHSQSEAEDAVQDVYVRLWERRRELRQIDNPRAYAMTMTRNHCINILNATIRHQARQLEAGNVTAGIERPDPHDEIESRDRVGKVFEVIGSLPDNQRQIITMHDIEGYTNDEIQRHTGFSTDNIRQLLSRAIKAIRNHFS